jgi:hypothetical protein
MIIAQHKTGQFIKIRLKKARPHRPETLRKLKKDEPGQYPARGLFNT